MTTVKMSAPARPAAPARHHGWRTSLAAFLTVLALAEAGAGVLAPRLPQNKWGLKELDEHAAQLEALGADHGERGSVLYAGSSSAGAAFDPSAIADALGCTAEHYVLWSNSGSGRSIAAIVPELGMARLDTATVVIGVTSRELNDAGARQSDAYQQIVTSSAWRRSVGAESVAMRLERVAGRWSNLVEHNSSLADPGTLLASLRESDLGTDVDLEPDGRRAWTRSEELMLSERHAAQEREALEGFAVGGRELAALEELIDSLHDQGVRVLLVDLPVLEEVWIPLHPGGAADIGAYNAALAGLAERTGVELLAAATADGWDKSLFVDENHLNARGATKLSALVSEALAGC